MIDHRDVPGPHPAGSGLQVLFGGGRRMRRHFDGTDVAGVQTLSVTRYLSSSSATRTSLPSSGLPCVRIAATAHPAADPGARTVDREVRFIDEAPQTFGQPVIAPGLAAVAVHALLDHDPVSVIGDDEAMEIEVKPILDRRAVDLGDKPARPGKCRAVETGPVPDRDELMRRLARVIAASPADMDAELSGQRCQAALQRR